MARKREPKGLAEVQPVDYSPQIEELRARPPEALTTIAMPPGDLGWAQWIILRLRAGERMPLRSVELAREVLQSTQYVHGQLNLRLGERQAGEDEREE